MEIRVHKIESSDEIEEANKAIGLHEVTSSLASLIDEYTKLKIEIKKLSRYVDELSEDIDDVKDELDGNAIDSVRDNFIKCEKLFSENKQKIANLSRTIESYDLRIERSNEAIIDSVEEAYGRATHSLVFAIVSLGLVVLTLIIIWLGA